jgi:hypothetical protein
MFGVRIIAVAGALFGAAIILPHDPAEARTHRQDSYSRYLPKSYVRHHRGSYAQQHHTRKSYAHKSMGKSYAHKSKGKSYAYKPKGKSYAYKSTRQASPSIQVKATAAAAVGPRPARWCGWWMRTQKGGGSELNLARNWKSWGRPSGPQVGAVVVWSHHVGMITGRTAGGQWIVKSGNDGGRVRERPRSVAGAVFRVA